MLLPLLQNTRALGRGVGATQRRIGKRHALKIDEKWVYFDDPQEIAELVKQEAVEEAQQTRRSRPRARLVVASGKPVVGEPAVTPPAASKPLQHKLRQTYRFAYEQAIKAIEQDEEDAIVALLS